jgi:hypothetical protein
LCLQNLHALKLEGIDATKLPRLLGAMDTARHTLHSLELERVEGNLDPEVAVALERLTALTCVSGARKLNVVLSWHCAGLTAVSSTALPTCLLKSFLINHGGNNYQSQYGSCPYSKTWSFHPSI